MGIKLSQEQTNNVLARSTHYLLSSPPILKGDEVTFKTGESFIAKEDAYRDGSCWMIVSPDHCSYPMEDVVFNRTQQFRIGNDFMAEEPERKEDNRRDRRAFIASIEDRLFGTKKEFNLTYDRPLESYKKTNENNDIEEEKQ